MAEEQPENNADEEAATDADATKTNGEKAPARKVTLSYEKYRRIANTLILFMRQEEDKPTESKRSFLNPFLV